VWSFKHNNAKLFQLEKTAAIRHFFHVEGDLAYCKICELNFANTNKNVYGYSRKGGNTSNLLLHLRDKHNITKDNYSEYLNEHEEVF
jgi:hypothetical protein